MIEKIERDYKIPKKNQNMVIEDIKNVFLDLIFEQKSTLNWPWGHNNICLGAEVGWHS